MLGLANGRPGARRFRQLLSVEAARRDARPSLLFEALEAVEALPAAAE
jgi:tRNA-dihydrouridine synthase A